MHRLVLRAAFISLAGRLNYLNYHKHGVAFNFVKDIQFDVLRELFLAIFANYPEILSKINPRIFLTTVVTCSMICFVFFVFIIDLLLIIFLLFYFAFLRFSCSFPFCLLSPSIVIFF